MFFNYVDSIYYIGMIDLFLNPNESITEDNGVFLTESETDENIRILVKMKPYYYIRREIKGQIRCDISIEIYKEELIGQLFMIRHIPDIVLYDLTNPIGSVTQKCQVINCSKPTNLEKITTGFGLKNRLSTQEKTNIYYESEYLIKYAIYRTNKEKEEILQSESRGIAYERK